jgi:hypothetical protein
MPSRNCAVPKRPSSQFASQPTPEVWVVLCPLARRGRAKLGGVSLSGRGTFGSVSPTLSQKKGKGWGTHNFVVGTKSRSFDSVPCGRAAQDDVQIKKRDLRLGRDAVWRVLARSHNDIGSWWEWPILFLRRERAAQTGANHVVIGCDFQAGCEVLAIFDNRTGVTTEKRLEHPQEAVGVGCGPRPDASGWRV